MYQPRHTKGSNKMERSLLILLVCCVGVNLALNSWELPQTNLLSFVNVELDMEWMSFKKSYNKTYADANEEVRRRLYWEDTMQFIREHNLKYDSGESTYMLGENDFADMAEDEFEKIYLTGLIVPEEEEEYPEALTEPDPEAPLEMDWRPKGLVSSVKNQGRCGSCWAFSALGSLEGQHKKKKGGSIKDLSEQNLVDCANSRWGNYGCRGGWMNNAFKYISSNRGINSESCYPYVGRDQYCRYRSSCVAATDKGSQNVGKSEHSLQSTLASVGPIAIAMDVNHRSFWYYKKGIHYEPRCNPSRPNHAMLTVGYGGSGSRGYWIIKNSWGTGWGDRGYVFTARGRGDNCGVARWASYPIV
ncbi:procathepsin L-like [Mercenaria mercenaria]|uniref:procathepsin L-like n=1 Tax=Mercenaria mercenaria TaxID=6596 RepID=UPI00234FA756|nr:procathepsin L-like [Mercenaria mercenaria]